MSDQSLSDWLAVSDMQQSKAWGLVMTMFESHCKEARIALRSRLNVEDYNYWCGFLDAADKLGNIIEDFQHEATNRE